MGFEIYILDLLGTMTFAFYGAHIGIQKKFDIFGICITAFLTAVGGGTLRELLVNQIPGYFSDMRYIAVIAIGIILAIVLFPVIAKINKYALIIDAVGLVTFAFIGATVANQYGFGAFGIIILATISAAGGGLLRDIAIAETPQVFYKDFYASPAVFLGIMFSLFKDSIQQPTIVYGILISAFLLRVLAIYFKVNLWGPWRKTTG